MKIIVRYISLIALVAITLASASCGLVTKPEDKIYHLVIFNDSDQDVKVQCLNPDIQSQGGTYNLEHGPGVCSFDIHKYSHTIVFKHVYTGDILRTIQIEPNSINSDRSHDGIQNIDAYYVYATGEYQNACAPDTTNN